MLHHAPVDKVVHDDDGMVDHLINVPLEYRGQEDLLQITIRFRPGTDERNIRAAILAQVMRSCTQSWGPGKLIPQASGRYRWEN